MFTSFELRIKNKGYQNYWVFLCFRHHTFFQWGTLNIQCQNLQWSILYPFYWFHFLYLNLLVSLYSLSCCRTGFHLYPLHTIQTEVIHEPVSEKDIGFVGNEPVRFKPLPKVRRLCWVFNNHFTHLSGSLITHNNVPFYIFNLYYLWFIFQKLLNTLTLNVEVGLITTVECTHTFSFQGFAKYP